MAARKDCYTDEEKAEIAAHVIVSVACGRFVSRIFREDETTENGIRLPHVSTFWKWVVDDEELDEKLVRARERGVEALLDETIDIADETTSDTIKDENGSERANNEWISRSRLRIDTRVKLAQMLKPKKYAAMFKHADAEGNNLPEIDDVTRAMRIAAVLNRVRDADSSGS